MPRSSPDSAGLRLLLAAAVGLASPWISPAMAEAAAAETSPAAESSPGQAPGAGETHAGVTPKPSSSFGAVIQYTPFSGYTGLAGNFQYWLHPRLQLAFMPAWVSSEQTHDFFALPLLVRYVWPFMQGSLRVGAGPMLLLAQNEGEAPTPSVAAIGGPAYAYALSPRLEIEGGVHVVWYLNESGFAGFWPYLGASVRFW